MTAYIEEGVEYKEGAKANLCFATPGRAFKGNVAIATNSRAARRGVVREF
jgi:hypothetical protein